jgi:hypothetical protein
MARCASSTCIEGSCPVQSLNCTREYRPQVCSYNGQGAFVGNNPCEAKLNVQIAACAADGSYDVTLVDCVDDSSIR